MAEAPSPSSSSTTDSVCSDESFEKVFMKNESGDGEIILLPKTKAITPGKSARSSYTTDQVPEEALNGDSVVGFFFNCLSSIGEETTIQRSPGGQKVLIVLAELKKGDPKYLADIATPSFQEFTLVLLLERLTDYHLSLKLVYGGYSTK